MSGRLDLADRAALREFYRVQLLEDCVPFWLERCLDRRCGGYLTMGVRLRDREIIARSCRVMEWTMRLGWDPVYAEALYAMLLAGEWFGYLLLSEGR